MSSLAPALDFALQPAGANDLDDVMGVMRAAFAPEYGESWTYPQCAGILPMPGVALTLARKSAGECVGFALQRTVADEAELLLIAVGPTARRRGVGRAMLDHFIDSATRSGATRLHLEVREGNQAIAMYRAAGFVLAGRRTNYYRGPAGEQFDALTLVRTNPAN